MFGERFNPMISLKALVYTKDLKPALTSAQEKLIRDQVMETELDGFTEYSAIGPIGVVSRSSGEPDSSGPEL